MPITFKNLRILSAPQFVGLICPSTPHGLFARAARQPCPYAYIGTRFHSQACESKWSTWSCRDPVRPSPWPAIRSSGINFSLFYMYSSKNWLKIIARNLSFQTLMIKCPCRRRGIVPGFESRHGVRFLGIYTLQCGCHDFIFIVIMCTWEK
jgi:hypothetical protein